MLRLPEGASGTLGGQGTSSGAVIASVAWSTAGLLGAARIVQVRSCRTLCGCDRQLGAVVSIGADDAVSLRGGPDGVPVGTGRTSRRDRAGRKAKLAYHHDCYGNSIPGHTTKGILPITGPAEDSI